MELWFLYVFFSHCAVTRVGVTRGGNWWCQPILSWKSCRPFFSHRPLKWWPFFAVISSPLPSSHVVYPVFFLKLATTINFIRVSPLDGVTRGGPPSPAPLVTPLNWSTRLIQKFVVSFLFFQTYQLYSCAFTRWQHQFTNHYCRQPGVATTDCTRIEIAGGLLITNIINDPELRWTGVTAAYARCLCDSWAYSNCSDTVIGYLHFGIRLHGRKNMLYI